MLLWEEVIGEVVSVTFQDNIAMVKISTVELVVDADSEVLKLLKPGKKVGVLLTDNGFRVREIG